jgi:hypothetical protein
MRDRAGVDHVAGLIELHNEGLIAAAREGQPMMFGGKRH